MDSKTISSMERLEILARIRDRWEQTLLSILRRGEWTTK